MTHLDTARIAAGRIREALERSELRRERQRLGQPEPLPLEAITTTTPPAPSPSPRDDAPAGGVRSRQQSGEE